MTLVDKLVGDYERLKDRAYNLNLYLNYVEQSAPTLFEIMQNRFSGMPGYASEEIITDPSIVVV